MNSLSSSFRLFLWLTFLTGVVYPLLVTLIGFTFVNTKRNGDIITFQNRVIGIKLIGQKFESDRYFVGRPSSRGYNALNSGGSNLGPTSLKLRKNVKQRQEELSKKFKLESIAPSDLLFASGSGLDPHISKEAALLQVDHIIASRNLNPATAEKKILELLKDVSYQSALFPSGKPYLNLLLLNLALDQIVEEEL